MTSSGTRGPVARREPSRPTPAPRLPEGLARALVPIALVFVAVGLSTAMASPFVTLFLTDAVHADGPRIALFLAAAPLSSVLVSTIVGRVSDRLPQRRGIMVAAALIGCTGAAVTAVVRDFWGLLLVTVTLTAAAGSLMPQMFAFAREALHGTGSVALTLSALRSLFSLAWVAGPPIAAVLQQAGGFTALYGAAAAMYAVAAVVVLVAPSGERRTEGPGPDADGPPGAAAVDASDGIPVVAASADDPTPDDRTPDAPPLAPVPRVVLWCTVIGFALARCAGSLAVQGLSLFTTHELHAGIGSAGLVLGVCAGLEIPLMLGLGALSARVSLHRLLVAGLACGVAYLVIVGVATDVWQLVVGQVLNATVVAATNGLGITYVQDLVPGRAGQGSTLYTNTFAVGAMLAGPLLGAAGTIGYRAPFLIGAGLTAASIVLLVVGRPRTVTA